MVNHRTLQSDNERLPLMADVDNHDDDIEPVSSGQANGGTNGNATHGHRSSHPHPDDPLDEDSDATATQLEVHDGAVGSGSDDNEQKWKRWRWVPFSVRRTWTATAAWCRGPPTPRRYRIRPLFPIVQEFPLRLLDRFVPRRRHRIGLVGALFLAWFLTFVLVKRRESLATEIEGWGAPVTIGCGAAYWGAGNACGLDGANCRPFNGSGLAFRCPAGCRGYQLLNYRAVGDQEIVYQTLVVGGPTSANLSDDSDAVYRGDSFICPAAIHAGVISNSKGGCGIVSLVGQRDNYVSSDRHGISSIAFDSYFPLSYTFVDSVECRYVDMRWALLGVSIAFSVVFSVFTSDPTLFFFGTFIALFWHVGLASDPPPAASNADLISDLVGKFLPIMFVGWVIYDKMGVRRTLTGLTAQLEKTVLWLGACWVGALENLTFDWIPIQRLNAHDLAQQPGARAALAIIIILLTAIAASQVWYFRQEGRLIKYLKLYALFIAGILICLVLPGLNLRIHHYILGLLLLPGTSMQTRPALLYQGLLVGLVISGVARWGFDSLLQTSGALQGDAPSYSALPEILDPVIAGAGMAVSNITFQWKNATGLRYDGISVLVNDVERFRSYFDDPTDNPASFVWPRHTGSSNQSVNEYFRFAYLEGSQTWDYTRAGIWNAQGDWVPMEAGPSKVKRDLEEWEDVIPLRN